MLTKKMRRRHRWKKCCICSEHRRDDPGHRCMPDPPYSDGTQCAFTKYWLYYKGTQKFKKDRAVYLGHRFSLMSEKSFRIVVLVVGILLTCIVKYSFDSYNDVFYPEKGLWYSIYLFLGSALISVSAVFGTMFIDRKLEETIPWKTKNNIFRSIICSIPTSKRCILSLPLLWVRPSRC